MPPSDLPTRLGDAIASLWTWLPGAAILGFAPGWTAWALLHADLDLLADNALAADQRALAVRWGLASLLLFLGLHLALWRRDRSRGFAGHAALWNRRLLLLAGAPLLVLFAEPELANRLGFVALLACLGLAGLAAASASAWPRGPDVSPRTLRILIGLAALAVTSTLIYLGVIRHHALLSNIFDLGIFENILWRTAHGEPLATQIFSSGTFNSEHFAPLLVLLAPLYAIAPHAETLIVLQTAWLCSAVIPLWLWTARQHDHPAVAAALCLAWLLSPFVHANALWDFHELGLGVPLVLWTLWALHAGRTRSFWLCAGALLLVREEMALVAALLGLYAILTGERRRGVLLLALSLAWFVLVARLLAPHAGLNAYPASLHGGLSDRSSYADLSTVLLADPLFPLLELLRASKFGLLLALLTPLVLLPALGGRILLLLLPGLAIVALSANKAVAHPGFHYTSFLLPVLFAAAPLGLRRLERWCGRPLVREAVAALVVAALALDVCLGALARNTSFRAGFSSVSWSLTAAERERHAWVRALAAELPPDLCVAATGKVGAQLAARRCLLRFGDPREVDVVVVLQSELHGRGAQPLRTYEAAGLRLTREAHGVAVYERAAAP